MMRVRKLLAVSLLVAGVALTGAWWFRDADLMKELTGEMSESEAEEEAEEAAAVKSGRLTGADRQLNGWFLTKGYPNPNNLSSKYEQAWQQHLAVKENTNKLLGKHRKSAEGTLNELSGIRGRDIKTGDAVVAGAVGSGGFGSWKMVGPKVFGGRILSLAINRTLHADGRRTIYAGSASGGIWRSYVDGVGADAWHPVKTDLPVLGVSSIVYHPSDTNILYAGTGEVYRVETLTSGTNSTSQIGNIGMNVWKARGTYGIGILKSVDGGKTWSRVFSRNTNELFAIQKIRIDPQNSSRIYACATDGLYRSNDAGLNWTRVWAATYVTDVAINPLNNNIVVVAAGNLTNPVKGIWRTTNAFATAPTRITAAPIPATIKGKIQFDYLALTATTTLLVASMPNDLSTTATGTSNVELYTSADFGATWVARSTSAFGGFQYWFANDIEINPSTTSQILAGGVNLYRYTVGASSPRALISSGASTMNSFITNGGSEGGTNYVHSDIHDIEYVPGSSTQFYVASDGGVFRTTNNGTAFTTCNGGLQVHQFYGPIAQSQVNANYYFGGLQDNNVIRSNATNTAWSREIGGDGGPTMFLPGNESVVIASRDARTVYHSINAGPAQPADFTLRLNNLGLDYLPQAYDHRTGFMAPIAAGPAGSNRVYVASDNLHISTNAGGAFDKNAPTAMTAPIEAQSKTAVALAVSPTNANKLYVSLSPIAQGANNSDALLYNPPANVWRSTTGGTGTTPFARVTGTIPDRFVMDFAISRTNDNVVYAAIGGFGTQHIFYTTDGGVTWMPRGSGLPDAPVNSVMIDPVNPRIIYAGSDLGVYVSPDEGINWYDFSNGFWDATYVIDLVAAPGGKIRAVTHGKGIFETDLFATTVMPVTFTSVSGEQAGGANLVKWQVAGEYDLAQYQVERSLDGSVFTPIGKVPARNTGGTHNYQYQDAKTTSSAYYRIRSVNVDGSYQYSPVIRLAGSGRSQVKVLQNPFREQLVLRFETTTAAQASIRLVHTSGQVVLTRKTAIQAGVQQEILPTASLAAGVYFVEAMINNQRWVEKVVRQ